MNKRKIQQKKTRIIFLQIIHVNEGSMKRILIDFSLENLNNY